VSNPAIRTITKFGGLTKCSVALGRAKSTIQRWQESGYIHPRHYPVIMHAAVTEGVVLDPKDFAGVDADHPAFNEPSTASPDSTADHARGSSPHPSADTEVSPPSDVDRTDAQRDDSPARGGDVSSSDPQSRSRAPAGAES
jgi:hypothetical protein